MPNCQSPDCESIDPLITPYVDGQLDEPDRRSVDEHMQACPPCQSRIAAERAVHDLIHASRNTLASECAPRTLHARCSELATGARDVADGARGSRAAADARLKPRAPLAAWRSRLAPLAAAASLVLIVGAAFLYQLTSSSARVMAAELAADHVKCFALNGLLQTRESPAAVESSMLSSFGWRMRLPEEASKAGLELVGARPCLYGEGKVAHIMYRHGGEPVSLFMLPKTARAAELVQVLGHRAAIWCVNDRTFVLVAREPRENVERMASLVRASLR